jgi:hypothetical protein
MVGETGQPYLFTNDNPLNATDPMGLEPEKFGGNTNANNGAIDQALVWGKVLAVDYLAATFAEVASQAALAEANTHSAQFANEAEYVAYAASGAARYYASVANSFATQCNSITVNLFVPSKSIQGITNLANGDAAAAHSSAVSTYVGAQALDSGFTFDQIFSPTTVSNIGTVFVGCASGVGIAGLASGGVSLLVPWADAGSCAAGVAGAYES